MSLLDRLKKLEQSAAAPRAPRCPRCAAPATEMYMALTDVLTGESHAFWLCHGCRVDALTGRRFMEWAEGIQSEGGAIVASMPPAALPSLAAGAPVPPEITHFYAPLNAGTPAEREL